MIAVESGKWEGLEELEESLLAEVRPGAAHSVKQAAMHMQNEVKKTLTGARSGRSYRVSKKGAVHIASAPGEPPAVLFGNLRNSVGHEGPTLVTPLIAEAMYGPGLC